MIVNKSLKQLLKTLNINLQTSAFIHDQLYVILSCITNIQKIIILPSKNGHRKTNNVVNAEILL